MSSKQEHFTCVRSLERNESKATAFAVLVPHHASTIPIIRASFRREKKRYIPDNLTELWFYGSMR